MKWKWYVAETKHNMEWLACDQLLRQGFDAFFPTYVSRGVIRTLFPHYIFVALDLSHSRWRSVNGTRGVKALLWGEDPAPLPDGVGDRMYCEGPLSDPDVWLASALVGQDVTVKADEVWVGQRGRVTGSVGNRVQVLLNLLGREVRREFHARDVA